MNLAFTGPATPWNAAASLIGLLVAFAAAVFQPSLLPAVTGVAALGAALALAALWRRFHAVPAHAAFIES